MRLGRPPLLFQIGLRLRLFSQGAAYIRESCQGKAKP